VEDKRRRVRPKKLSTADKQYLKVMSLRKRKTIQQRPDTGPERCIWTFSWSIYCWPKPHHKWFPWKDGCQEAIHKEGKQGEKTELCQSTHEVDWKSVATGVMEGWILPRARTSTLLKQCGIILTVNGTKGSRHPEKSFGMSFKKPGELFLKTT